MRYPSKGKSSMTGPKKSIMDMSKKKPGMKSKIMKGRPVATKTKMYRAKMI